MRILIAEDETELAKGLKFLLEKNKFTVDAVRDGEEALTYFQSRDYDVVILDIMMPKVNGLEVLWRIREVGSGVPVLMLTAKAEIEDRVAGLEAGADDYLPKPFASPEFIARVKALSRRNAGYAEACISFGNVRLDCNRYEMSGGNRSVRLNNKEFQVTVMLLIIVGINAANYYRTTSMQDHLTKELLSQEQSFRERPKMPPRAWDISERDPEAAFMTRFFTVHCDMDGRVKEVLRDNISSVDEETAKEYAQVVFSRGREKGYFKNYRYLMGRSDKGASILFVNSTIQLQSMRSLFLVSLAIGIFSLLLVFFLVLVFSKRAIRPYLKNLEQQKQFITDAGHELKTPITSIATSADIAAMEHEGDEWIENIRKQSARLTKLVGDMVALSRLDEETPFPKKDRFSLSEAAWETAEPFAQLAKANGKHYSQQIEEDLIFSGDRDAIQRMISILLDNAVRYSDDGGEISLRIYRRRGKVCIEMTNECSLPDVSDLDRLFDRFYRLDESRSAATGGTGIGLSMVRAIAETHGGKATVQSADGKEICFRVVM